MKVVILGATGMLGNALFRWFAASPNFDVYGSARSEMARGFFDESLRARILVGGDAGRTDAIGHLLDEIKPELVVNCIGLVKQLAAANDPLQAIPINSMLPHQLAKICGALGARLIQISTDCVFSGTRGSYSEGDAPDAEDLYGRTKCLGELHQEHTVTLRTSIIGHEVGSSHRGLVDWFLSQRGFVKGYRRAIFSGLPTIELARVIRDFVLPNAALSGVHHVAAAAISKYDLLRIIAREYGSRVEIRPDDEVVIDRSLDGSRFAALTGYMAPAWPELIGTMRRLR